MKEWSVFVECVAPPRTRRTTVDDAVVDRFLDLLAPHGAIVSGGAGYLSYSARLSVEAPDAKSALRKATSIVRAAVRHSGLPEWEVAECSATREDRLAVAEAAPVMEFVGAAEAAKMLGVSRQRITQLRRDNPHFPLPLAELASGSVFSKAAIERFLEEWQRTPGRPKRTPL